jgi:hypothetical protein
MAKCLRPAPVDEAAAKAQTGMTGARRWIRRRNAAVSDGTWHYDSLECRNRFTRNPDGYLKQA